MSSISRQKLLEDFIRLGRENSSATILYHSAIGQKVGLTLVELKCIDILSRHGPLTAGELGAHMYLTSGAITNLIDRLAKRGVVHRTRDRADRRKVYIECRSGGRIEEIAPLFKSLSVSFQKLVDEYNDEDLVKMHEFMTKIIAMMHTETVKLASKPADN